MHEIFEIISYNSNDENSHHIVLHGPMLLTGAGGSKGSQLRCSTGPFERFQRAPQGFEPFSRTARFREAKKTGENPQNSDADPAEPTSAPKEPKKCSASPNPDASEGPDAQEETQLAEGAENGHPGLPETG